MKKLVLIVLLPRFADWEASFTSAALNHQIQDQESKYFVKTVGVTDSPITSIGGLTINTRLYNKKYSARLLCPALRACP